LVEGHPGVGPGGCRPELGADLGAADPGPVLGRLESIGLHSRVSSTGPEAGVNHGQGRTLLPRQLHPHEVGGRQDQAITVPPTGVAPVRRSGRLMHRHRRPASIPRGSRAGPEVDRCAHESRRARGGLRLGPSGRAKEAKERWGGHRTCHAPYRPVERLLTVRAGLPAPANSGLAGACGAVGTPTPGPCPRLALNRGRTPVAGSPGRCRQMRRRRPRPTSTGPGNPGARGGAPETS
jgi:hypothetical protein